MEPTNLDRAQFHAMTQSTRDEWQLIGRELEHFASKLPERLIAHLDLLRGDYGSFPVDRPEHCLQTATRAYQAGRDEEYVVCALLHDIGDTLGPYNHADVAAVIVQPFVSEANHWMVEHHGVFQGCYFFHFLGIDRDQREQFRGHPHFDKAEEFSRVFESGRLRSQLQIDAARGVRADAAEGIPPPAPIDLSLRRSRFGAMRDRLLLRISNRPSHLT
jgi:predicted HD phosphohydrolase